MTFTASNEGLCEINQVAKFASEADYPDTISATGTNPPRIKFTIDAEVPVKNEVIFSVGNSANAYRSAALKAEIIVCGRETLGLT